MNYLEKIAETHQWVSVVWAGVWTYVLYRTIRAGICAFTRKEGLPPIAQVRLDTLKRLRAQRQRGRGS